MTNSELQTRLGELVARERGITNEILHLINEAERRRLYLELGYSSMFDWLVKGFRYSAAAAYRRIQAARLLRSVPEIEEKLQSGKINLTSLAKVQTAIRKEERRTMQVISTPEKKDIISMVQGKSSDQVMQTMLSLFPNSESKQESLKIISAEDHKLTIILNANQIRELNRARELLSHVKPEASWSEIVAYLTHEFLKRKDPLAKSLKSKALTHQVSAAVSPRVGKNISSATRKFVFHRDEGKCQFVDPKTGHLCESRYKIELDHIQPRGMGGGDEPENLRCLCRKHNLLMAERNYGKEFMSERISGR